METRRIIIWAALIGIGGYYISQKWDSFDLPGGFSGFLLFLFALAIIFAVVRVLRA